MNLPTKAWPALLLLTGCVAGPGGEVRGADGEDALRGLREEVAALRAEQARESERVSDLERLARRMEVDLALRRAEKEDLREEILREVRQELSPSDPRQGAVRVPVPHDDLADARRQPDRGGADASPPADLYREAFDSLIQENYGDAIRSFKAFLLAYPHHEFADEAQFHLGEGYFALKDYGRALIEYSKVLHDYPRESRAPDALYQAARCHRAMGQDARARDAMNDVIAKFPGTPAADKARRWLDEGTE